MENQSLLDRNTLWLMVIGAGLVVANIYYAQPLLGKIAVEFQVQEVEASRVVMLNQLGYAMGILMLVPLGDILRRRRVILIDFVFMIASLICVAFSPNLMSLMIGSFFVGVTSVVPQLFIPMVATLAAPKERGKSIGLVMSGLLVGILLSRTISGVIGEHFGWRAMFYVATVLMVGYGAWVAVKLPEIHPTFQIRYHRLMLSIIKFVKHEPVLRLAAMRQFFAFFGFSAFWTTLVFLLEEPPYNAGSDVAGMFGLVGACGALSATMAGRLADKWKRYTLILYSIGFMIAGWVVFGIFPYSYLGLILGVILLDIGVQGQHISNQVTIFAINPEARNRFNTVYMFTTFIGGSLGTVVGAKAWDLWKWNGVVGTCLAACLILLMIHWKLADKNK